MSLQVFCCCLTLNGLIIATFFPPSAFAFVAASVDDELIMMIMTNLRSTLTVTDGLLSFRVSFCKKKD